PRRKLALLDGHLRHLWQPLRALDQCYVPGGEHRREAGDLERRRDLEAPAPPGREPEPGCDRRRADARRPDDGRGRETLPAGELDVIPGHALDAPAGVDLDTERLEVAAGAPAGGGGGGGAAGGG